MGSPITGQERSPSVPEHLDGLKTLEEDASSEHRVGQSAVGIGCATGNSGLSIADRALMRRFGNQETEQGHRSQSGGISAKVAAGKGSETVHIPDETVSLQDRILLRKYSEAPSVISSTVGLGGVGTTSVPSPAFGDTTVVSKKRRRFIGKGNTKASGIGTDVGGSHLHGTSSLLDVQIDESSSGTLLQRSPRVCRILRVSTTRLYKMEHCRLVIWTNS